LFQCCGSPPGTFSFPFGVEQFDHWEET
jgi:hypothetical protein